MTTSDLLVAKFSLTSKQAEAVSWEDIAQMPGIRERYRWAGAKVVLRHEMNGTGMRVIIELEPYVKSMQLSQH